MCALMEHNDRACSREHEDLTWRDITSNGLITQAESDTTNEFNTANSCGDDVEDTNYPNWIPLGSDFTVRPPCMRKPSWRR